MSVIDDALMELKKAIDNMEPIRLDECTSLDAVPEPPKVPFRRFPHTCPLCGSPGLQMTFMLECSNSSCRNYVAL